VHQQKRVAIQLVLLKILTKLIYYYVFISFQNMPKNYFKTFASAGALILRRQDIEGTYTDSFDRDYRSFFGCSPTVCGVIWVKCQGFSLSTQPKHLLWALLFLKCYATEKKLATLVGISCRQHYRETVWPIILKLSFLRNSVVSILKVFLS